MNELITVTNGTAVTSTFAIAEGTDNEHHSVMRMVRTYKDDLAQFGLVRFEIRARSPGQHGGADMEYANLNEHQATLLMTYLRNSDIVRAFKVRLVKAFYELAIKARQDPMVSLNDPATMRGLLLSYADKVIALETVVAEQRPKVAAFERITVASGSCCMTDAAKVLGIPRDKFIAKLYEMKWIQRRGNGWSAIAAKERPGYITLKTGYYTNQKTGEDVTTQTVYITAKGLTELAMILGKYPVLVAHQARQQELALNGSGAPA